ncbi:hypothetical protein NZA98_18710, partial [Escherichia coli]|nr:hypothetical protein [Escherichia coli]
MTERRRTCVAESCCIRRTAYAKRIEHKKKSARHASLHQNQNPQIGETDADDKHHVRRRLLRPAPAIQ